MRTGRVEEEAGAVWAEETLPWGAWLVNGRWQAECTWAFVGRSQLGLFDDDEDLA